VAAGLAEELGVATRDWGDGLWSVRCASLPGHQPGNQITGVRPADLDRLPDILAWFDEAGTDVNLRWPGPALERAAGQALVALGFAPNELEAWMCAPIDALEMSAVAHDIREVAGPEDVAAYGEAFVRGWDISERALASRVALAAMAPWPGPEAWRRYTAFVGGEPAGEALLTRFGEVAYLAEASTVPRFRRRGIQRALITRRVADARAEGTTTVFGSVQYGDQSWANMRAMGLRETFMTVSFRRARKS
jgi:hypothetical protein